MALGAASVGQHILHGVPPSGPPPRGTPPLHQRRLEALRVLDSTIEKVAKQTQKGGVRVSDREWLILKRLCVPFDNTAELNRNAYDACSHVIHHGNVYANKQDGSTITVCSHCAIFFCRPYHLHASSSTSLPCRLCYTIIASQLLLPFHHSSSSLLHRLVNASFLHNSIVKRA
ncbi:hypothetical protein Fmac_007821 [Flemingia macrophylla]|uniref:Uncharacterized protein n=1 Tax=Flemingia macrophylla TaxID=520843 RepID=A0ABD1MVM2_9FABA